jgi:hypothetical protein
MTRERPILFNGPMVRAILDGRKTQTRRIVKHLESRWDIAEDEEGPWPYFPEYVFDEPEPVKMACPYGKPGDRLRISEEVTVKAVDYERYAVLYHAPGMLVERFGTPELIAKIRGYKTGHLRGIHLPPAYARPERLEITGVRVERLRDISEADAMAEGVERPVLSATELDEMPVHPMTGSYVDGFRKLWQSINGPDSWQANPWVWVVSFKQIKESTQ